MTLALSLDDKLSIMESSLDGFVVVDTEGYGQMSGFSFAVHGFNQGFYLPFRHAQGNLSESQQKKAFEILEEKILIMHNAVHDLTVLKRDGFDFEGLFFCTMLMAHWINEEQFDYSLDAVSRRTGGQPKAMPEQMSRIIASDGWNAVPVAWMDEYSSNDSFITLQAFDKMLPEFEKQKFTGTLWETEQAFQRLVMGPMKELGIKIDTGFCIREYMRGEAIMMECTRELGFKPSRPTELKKFLIDDLQLPIVKHTKACTKCYPPRLGGRWVPPEPATKHEGKPSFDKSAMEIYETMLEKKDDPRATTILRYRGWLKTNSSNYKPYMELVDNEGVLHPGYKLHGTKTGRLSCAEPNLQQIPKSSDKDWNGGLKTAFIARDGFGLWTVDYSQLQFRMTCAYAGQEDLIAIFNDEERDIFSEMASQMGWVRDDVKTLVYLIMFGGGGSRASVAFGVNLTQGKELVEEFHTLYPGIKRISKQAENAARKQGFVQYWTGRRRHFPKGAAYYRALNAVIQGGEAEIIKKAMILIQETVADENCHLILQIHDEVVLEIKEGMEDYYIPLVQNCMVKACEGFNEFVDYPVRFKTSAGRWGSK